MAESTEGTITELLLGKLETLDNCPPIAHPNVKFPGIAPDGTPQEPPADTYLEAAILWAPPVEAMIGGQHRKMGILQVTILDPLGQGDVKASNLAGKISALFAQNTVIEGGGVRIWITEPPYKNAGYRDKERWRTPVSIRWNTYSP